jgi:hypothetical protein
VIAYNRLRIKKVLIYSQRRLAAADDDGRCLSPEESFRTGGVK